MSVFRVAIPRQVTQLSFIKVFLFNWFNAEFSCTELIFYMLIHWRRQNTEGFRILGWPRSDYSGASASPSVLRYFDGWLFRFACWAHTRRFVHRGHEFLLIRAVALHMLSDLRGLLREFPELFRVDDGLQIPLLSFVRVLLELLCSFFGEVAWHFVNLMFLKFRRIGRTAGRKDLT